MTRRITTILIIILFAFSAGMTSYAAGNEETVNLDVKYKRDYSTDTGILNGQFNAGRFSVQLMEDNIGWLGISGRNTGKVNIKSGAGIFSIAGKLPALKEFVSAEISACVASAGNTFTCRNQGSWDVKNGTGSFITTRNDPAGRIRSALEAISGYIEVSTPEYRHDDDVNLIKDRRLSGKWSSRYPDLMMNNSGWFDNLLEIPAGTVIKYGDRKLIFTKKCLVDELYDPIMQESHYESTFAENIFDLKNAVDLRREAGNGVTIMIPEGLALQFGGRRYEASKAFDINISCDVTDGSPLTSFKSALDTARKTGTKYESVRSSVGWRKDGRTTADGQDGRDLYIHTCDADAVFGSGFDLLNGIIGALAKKDTVLYVAAEGGYPEEGGSVTSGDADNSSPAGSDICAELKISSVKMCGHERKEFRNGYSPTIFTKGYEGDIFCTDCQALLGSGAEIPKLPSSIKLYRNNKNTAVKTISLKTGKTDTSVKVAFVSGDGIKSVTSSNNNIVKAGKAGSSKNKIRLKTFRKTGTATVTVKLKAGKSATLKVRVKSAPCTKLVIKSKTKVTLKKGKTHKIKAVRKPAACVQKITYKSSDKKVATVTSKGRIKAGKKGKAKITVKCGSRKKTITVRVK